MRPMTVPFIMALGVGLSAARSDPDSAEDSFGLVALCSIGPIVMVLLLGIFYHPSDAFHAAAVVPAIRTTYDVVRQFIVALPLYTEEVLTGVNMGILWGEGLGESAFRWLLVPIGAVIGYYIVKEEPAVQILNQQVEDLTSGTASRGMMNLSLSAGVACAVALAMARVLTELNIY